MNNHIIEVWENHFDYYPGKRWIAEWNHKLSPEDKIELIDWCAANGITDYEIGALDYEWNTAFIDETEAMLCQIAFDR